MTRKEFQIQDPDYKTKIRESWEKQGFLKYIGAEIDDVSAGYCQISLPIEEKLSQAHGYVSGSIIGALADVAGGYAAFTVTKPGMTMLTAEYKINFMNPAIGVRLIGRGYLEKPGSRLSVARSDVFAVNEDGEETQAATALMTMITLVEENQ